MFRRHVLRSSGELPEQAISQKSRSHAGGVFRGGLGNAPTSRESSGPVKAGAGRFGACEGSQALLATISSTHTYLASLRLA